MEKNYLSVFSSENKYIRSEITRLNALLKANDNNLPHADDSLMEIIELSAALPNTTDFIESQRGYKEILYKLSLLHAQFHHAVIYMYEREIESLLKGIYPTSIAAFIPNYHDYISKLTAYRGRQKKRIANLQANVCFTQEELVKFNKEENAIANFLEVVKLNMDNILTAENKRVQVEKEQLQAAIDRKRKRKMAITMAVISVLGLVCAILGLFFHDGINIAWGGTTTGTGDTLIHNGKKLLPIK